MVPLLCVLCHLLLQVLHYRHQLALSMQREAQEKGEQDSLIDAANRQKQAQQVRQATVARAPALHLAAC